MFKQKILRSCPFKIFKIHLLAMQRQNIDMCFFMTLTSDAIF